MWQTVRQEPVTVCPEQCSRMRRATVQQIWKFVTAPYRKGSPDKACVAAQDGDSGVHELADAQGRLPLGVLDRVAG